MQSIIISYLIRLYHQNEAILVKKLTAKYVKNLSESLPQRTEMVIKFQNQSKYRDITLLPKRCDPLCIL